MNNSDTSAHHLKRVRNYFATLPPLQPETVDIILRTYLHIPEELMQRARVEAECAHATESLQPEAVAA